jgi:hypothetical protein
MTHSKIITSESMVENVRKNLILLQLLSWYIYGGTKKPTKTLLPAEAFSGRGFKQPIYMASIQMAHTCTQVISVKTLKMRQQASPKRC